MIEAIKKAVLAGVGAAAMTTERAEKVLNELVEKGKISASEAKEAAQKISDQGKTEFEEAAAKVQTRVDGVLERFRSGQTERVDALETKIAILEERIAKLEAGDPSGPAI